MIRSILTFLALLFDRRFETRREREFLWSTDQLKPKEN